MYTVKYFNKNIVARIILALVIMSLLFGIPYILSEGLKRHGEDIGKVPLAVPVNELKILSSNILKTLLHINNSSLKDILHLLMFFGKGLNNESIIWVSNKLFKNLNNTSIPWMNRIDYMSLALLASIEDIYDKAAIIDPVRLITLIKKYEEDHREWLMGVLEKKEPVLAKYVKEYNAINNSSIKKILLGEMQKILRELVDNGRIDILLLVAETLNTSIQLGFNVDRIKLAEYLNNTSQILRKYHTPGITEIIRLLRTISSKLYRGEVVSAWQYFALLKNEVLRLNVTLSFEDAIRLSSLLSITGITINGAYLSLNSLKTMSSTIADILSSQNYDIRLKATKILTGLSPSNERGREVSIERGSFKVLSMILAVNESKINFSMIALRQPPSNVRGEYISPVIGTADPVLFIIVLALSATIAGAILYSTIQVSSPVTRISKQEKVFNEVPLRKDKYAKIIVEYYMRALKLLSSKGYPRRCWETPREHLKRLRGTACYEPFSVLVGFYERTIFAGKRVVAEEKVLDELLEEIEKCR